MLPQMDFGGDQFRPCWFWHLTVAVPTSCRRDFSGKSLRNSQQDSTRVLSAHEAVMEITVLQCRHPHEHTPGVMSGRGDITPPGPSRQRRGKATASTDSDQNRKYFKNKELTTNQELYSQSNRLATHRCPQNSSTSNSNYRTRYRELGLGRTARHQCAVVYTVRYTETHQVLKHKAQQRNLWLPSTNISGNRGSESGRAPGGTASAASDTQLGSNEHHPLLWEFVWLDFSNSKLHLGHSLQNNLYPFSAQRLKCPFQISKFVLSKKKKI